MAAFVCSRCKLPMRPGDVVCTVCGNVHSNAKAIMAFLCAFMACFTGLYWAYTTYFAGHPIELRHVMSGSADPEAPAIPVQTPGWLYFQTKDELAGDVTRHARVISLSDHVAGAPANDRNTTGVLELRASTLYGPSAVITLRRHNFTLVDPGCVVRVQFDDAAPVPFQAACSLDETSVSMVVTDVKGFTSLLLNARKMTADAQLSEKNERVAVFDVAGLHW